MIKVVFECEYEHSFRNVEITNDFENECTDLMEGVKQLKKILNDSKKILLKNDPDIKNVNIVKMEIE